MMLCGEGTLISSDRDENATVELERPNEAPVLPLSPPPHPAISAANTKPTLDINIRIATPCDPQVGLP
jgi:hypothetical protein